MLSPPEESVSFLLPGAGTGATAAAAATRRQTWRLGVLLCLVLSAHNLPEGVAVGVGVEKSAELGGILASAILLHNVAEGFVTAVPLLAATGNRAFAFGVTALSGLTEPVGAFLGVLALRALLAVSNGEAESAAAAAAALGDDPVAAASAASAASAAAVSQTAERFLNVVLCGVGGVMLHVSVRELLPQAALCGTARSVAGGFVSGAAASSLTALLLLPQTQVA